MTARFELTRRALRSLLVGGGRFTWVHEPGSALAVNCWPFSQVLHAFALTDTVAGPARFPGLGRGLRGYRSRQGGYQDAVARGERYYDDNAWLGLAFLQRHLLTHDADAHRRAQELDEFVYSGLDACGGIRWVEHGTTVNACSTGAGAVLRARLGGRIGPQLEFLQHLRNADGVVRDHLRADGTIDSGLFSYNQGLLIAAALAAGDQALAEDAAAAGLAHFSDDVLWAQPVSFNAIYLRALLRMGFHEPVARYADRLWTEGRDEDGWFTRAGRYDEGVALDTAGALQILTLLAFPNLVARSV